MECLTGAATLGSAEAFKYNRENFLYDRELRFKKELQLQDFRVAQAKQWREDVRDLISLSEYKMHVYLLVNVLLLGHTVVIWCQGKLPGNTPDWLMAGESISTSGALMCLLLSIWMAMHAAVAAQSYEARLLTQLVRLPIPNWQEIEGCRTTASEFEKIHSRQMFRIPFAMGWQEENVARTFPVAEESQTTQATQRSVAGDASPQEGSLRQPLAAASASDPWGLERPGDGIAELGYKLGSDVAHLRHVKIARQAMVHWQAYDAYARISMSVGVNQLLLAMSYYILGYVLVEVGTRDAAACGVILLSVLQLTLIRLDISLTTRQLWVIQGMQGLGPLAATTAAYWWSQNEPGTGRIAEVCSVVAFAAHGCFILLLTYYARIEFSGETAMLPRAFSSVLYLDAFGAVHMDPNIYQRRREEDGAAGRAASAAPRPSSQLPEFAPGTQPALYRPEDLAPPESVQDLRGLPGAPAVSRQANPSDADDGKFFDADSWVRYDENGVSMSEAFVSGHGGEVPRVVPWRIFSFATRCLGAAWFLACVAHGFSAWTGWDFQVEARLGEAFAQTSGSPGGSALLLQLSGLAARQHTGQVSRRMGLEEVEVSGLDPELGLRSLACDADGRRFVVSDGLFLYTARLETQASPTVAFERLDCPLLEGEGMQDAAVLCHDGGGKAERCQTVALHRNGRRVAACSLPGHQLALAARGFTANVSDSWLERLRVADAATASHTRLEKVVSITRDADCADDASVGDNPEACVLLGTTHGRVVQVQQHSVNGNLVPSEILSSGHDFGDLSPGSVRAFDDRHVAVLKEGGRMLALIDSENGKSAGWIALPERLPANSFCIGGGFAYLLSGGPARRLWRFRAPRGAAAARRSA